MSAVPPDFAAVDAVLAKLLAEEDVGLAEAERAGTAAGLPAIGVTPLQGKFLHLLLRAVGARRVLELGTLAGYSSIWLARALPPEGRLVTVELQPAYAEVARANLERAGVLDRVELRVGPALEVVPTLAGPFGVAFLDADKQTMAEQVEAVVALVRPGGLLICDNVVRRGAVADPQAADASALGARRALELLGRDPRLDASALQTVGAKGHDGFALAVVR